jgi:hypothetical protein
LTSGEIRAACAARLTTSFTGDDFPIAQFQVRERAAIPLIDAAATRGVVAAAPPPTAPPHHSLGKFYTGRGEIRSSDPETGGTDAAADPEPHKAWRVGL